MAGIKVLVATTTWWPTAAYMAIACKRAGATVVSLSPLGNPLRTLKCVDAAHTYSARGSSKSFVEVITSFEPDIIIPMDDRTVEHMHVLHADLASGRGRDNQAVRDVIERSLGDPSGYCLSGTRHAFLEEMRKSGVLVPDGAELSSDDDIEAWCARHKPPWVIKAEGSWGGSGVIVASTVRDAKAAYKDLASPLAAHKALRFRLVGPRPFRPDTILSQEEAPGHGPGPYRRPPKNLHGCKLAGAPARHYQRRGFIDTRPGGRIDRSPVDRRSRHGSCRRCNSGASWPLRVFRA